MSVPFPTLFGAVITQYPYKETSEWFTTDSTVEAGQSYTGVNNVSELRRFEVSYPMITRDEVTILEDFFNSMRGRLGEFTFTDDDGVTQWFKCRFDQDEFQVQHSEQGAHSVSLKIVALPNPSNVAQFGGLF